MKQIVFALVLIISVFSTSTSYAIDNENESNKIVAIEKDNIMTIVITPELENDTRSSVIPPILCKYCGGEVNLINSYNTEEWSNPECDLGHTNCNVNQVIYYNFTTYNCSNCGTYTVRTWIRTLQTHNYS